MKKVYKKVLLVFVSLLVAVQFSSSWILAEGDIINTNDYEEEMDETIAEDPTQEIKLDEQAPTDETGETDKKDETESTEGDKTAENVVEDTENVEENNKVENKTTVQGKSDLNRTVGTETLGTFTELFEDEYFAKYIADYSGKNVDEEVTQTDLDRVTYISFYGEDYSGITDLSGIQLLQKLQSLDISETAIKNLDEVHDMEELRYITANDTKNLVSINGMKNLPNIVNVSISNSAVKEIGDFEDTVQIDSLSVTNGDLNKVNDLSNQTELSDLNLNKNKLVSLDGMRKITSLESLDIANNNITNLNSLNAPMLYSLTANDNKLTSVNGLANSASLEYAYLQNNLIQSVAALVDCTNMYSINLQNNQLQSVEGLQNMSRLSYELNLTNNQITSLSAFATSSLDVNTLYLDNNKLTSLDGIESISSLYYLSVENNMLENINAISNLTNLGSLNVNNNNISEVTLSNELSNLYELRIANNQLENIDFLKKCPYLMTYGYNVVDLSNNEISSLGVFEEFTTISIGELNLSNNQITSLTSLKDLETSSINNLNISNNKITSFNGISSDTTISYLNASYNPLEGEDALLALNNIAAHIYDLNLSHTQITNEMFDKVNWEDMEQLYGTLDLSNNQLTKLDFLKYFVKDEHGNYNGSLDVWMDGNDLSTLDVSVLDLFNNDYYSIQLRLSMVGSNISDLSSFEGKQYNFNLRLQLDENHISDISPLYTHFEFLVGREPGDYIPDYELSVENQTITVDNEVSDEDSSFTIENIVKQLDSGIVDPFFISNEGSYSASKITWNLTDVTVEDGYAKTYYDFTSDLGTYSNPPAEYRSISMFGTPAPAGEPMYFSGRVTINTKVNTTSEEVDTYKITYNGNGHTSGDAPVDTTEYDANASVSVLGQNTLKKTGYTFLGWSEDAKATAADYKEKDTLTITSDVTLYAVWKLDGDPTNPVDPVDPVDPIDPTDPVDPSKPTDPTTPGKPTEPSESVASGDTTNLYLWLSLSTIAGLASLLVLKKKREESK